MMRVALGTCGASSGHGLAAFSLLADIESTHFPNSLREQDRTEHDGDHISVGPARVWIETARDGEPCDKAERAGEKGFKRGHTRHTHLGYQLPMRCGLTPTFSRGAHLTALTATAGPGCARQLQRLARPRWQRR